MRVLVTGAGGAVGSQLVPRLLADGHDVRALVRRPVEDELIRRDLEGVPAPNAGRSRAAAEAPRGPSADVRVGDALSGAGLAEALERVDVAYYLLHSMRSADAEQRAIPFPERERAAAENFAAAASAAGVRRVVYLGGPIVRDRPPSRHLASREAVEGILWRAVPEPVVLRASIIIGARSRSFRFMVRLIERLPMLTLPPWRSFRTRPIDARDVTQLLAASATARVAGEQLEIGGPDVLTYEQMMARIAELMMLNRPTVPLLSGGGLLGARFAAAVAGEDPELVGALMESLAGDLVLPEHSAGVLADIPRHSFDSAVEHALGDWERSEQLAAR
jgi:uncharacterized protein YbjT (DUF2867 family)